MLRGYGDWLRLRWVPVPGVAWGANADGAFRLKGDGGERIRLAIGLE